MNQCCELLKKKITYKSIVMKRRALNGSALIKAKQKICSNTN